MSDGSKSRLKFWPAPESRFQRNLKTFERIMVTVAAVFAIFPLYQYMLESNDRRDERLSIYINTIAECNRELQRPDEALDELITSAGASISEPPRRRGRGAINTIDEADIEGGPIFDKAMFIISCQLLKERISKQILNSEGVFFRGNVWFSLATNSK